MYSEVLNTIQRRNKTRRDVIFVITIVNFRQAELVLYTKLSKHSVQKNRVQFVIKKKITTKFEQSFAGQKNINGCLNHVLNKN